MNQDNLDHEHLEIPMGVHPELEEVRESPRFRQWWVGTWFAPLLVSVGMLLWCVLAYLFIGDRPRDWNYGVLPYVPGQSIFSTNRVPHGATPNQVALPEDASDVENAKP